MGHVLSNTYLQYGGNNMTKIKKRLLSLALAILTMLTMVPAFTASAAAADGTTNLASLNAIYNGGWAMMSATRTVYETYNSSSGTLSTSKGTVYAYEGITVLEVLGNNVYHIQYSISSSPSYKQGYVQGGVNTAALSYTCVATVNTSSTVYYGNSTSKYEPAGSVSSGEIVSVIAANSPWAYIEYDTTAGRKRGYININNITMSNRPSWMLDLYLLQASSSDVAVNGTVNVYAGPSELYAKVESVGLSDNGRMTCYYSQSGENGKTYCYITYIDDSDSANRLKSGFIVQYDED